MLLLLLLLLLPLLRPLRVAATTIAPTTSGCYHYYAHYYSKYHRYRTHLAPLRYENDDPLVGELDLSPPEFETIKSIDGAVDLHMAVYRPPAEVFGDGPFPTLVSVYGGPHVQTVSNTYALTSDMRAQFLRGQGCVRIALLLRAGYY